MTISLLCGCSPWQQARLAPAAFVPPPATVRVTRTDGWRAVINAPQFQDDTVRGVRAAVPYDTIAMAARDVREIAIRPKRELSEGNVQGLVIGAFILIFLGIGTIVALTGD